MIEKRKNQISKQQILTLQLLLTKKLLKNFNKHEIQKHSY